MSRAALLQQIDADELDAFATLGATDAAEYTPPGVGQTAIPCTVFVEELVPEGVGRTAQTVAPIKRVEFKRAQVSPVRLGTVLIDGITYRLESIFDYDASKTIWTVNRVIA